jgi:hypothetical protein
VKSASPVKQSAVEMPDLDEVTSKVLEIIVNSEQM